MQARQEYLWVEVISTVLEHRLTQKADDMGFVQSTFSDPCVYKKDSGGDIFIIGIYVDDIVLAGRRDRDIEEVKTVLAASCDQ